MIFKPTPFSGCFEVLINPIADHRGWFGRTFCKKEFAQIGHTKEWVQMNHTYTKKIASIRGMHFQYPPFSETKLVRCIRGKVFDVVIDLRENSKTFLQWYSIELSKEKANMLYIPEGFAHGFQTMTRSCELLYNHSSYYEPGSEAGIRYDDPLIGIAWPLPPENISERDLKHPYIQNNFNGISL